jgi:hypothetical protein
VSKSDLCVNLEAVNETTDKKRYQSDLTDEKWAILEPLLPINTGPAIQLRPTCVP